MNDVLTPKDDAEERRLLAVVFGVLLLAFWPTLATFYGSWARSSQEHGFFVAGLTLWLVWSYRDRFRRAPGDALPILIPVAVGLSLAWMAAVVMNVMVVHHLLFVLALTTWAFVTFGARAKVPILAVSATFLLAIPFWGAINPVLQRATTIMSGAIARAGGVNAVIRDDTITISSGTFLVESGCSGINFFLAGLTLGAFYGHFFTDRWQTQLKIVALSGAVAAVANWIRVAVLILLGEATAMQSPHIRDHFWQGWAIFTLLMIPTYFLVRWIERRDARKTAAERPSRPVPDTFDPGRPRRAARAGAFVLVGPVLYSGLGALPSFGQLDRSPEVLGVADAWTVTERPAGDPAWTPAYEGIDGQMQWTVSLPDASVDAARYYFVDQRQGEEMIGNSNAMASDSLRISERLVGPVGAERRYVREAIFLHDDAPRIAWYWYRVAGVDTPFPSRAKLLEIPAFLLRAPAAELITLSAPCAPDDCSDAARALRRAVQGQSEG